VRVFDCVSAALLHFGCFGAISASGGWGAFSGGGVGGVFGVGAGAAGERASPALTLRVPHAEVFSDFFVFSLDGDRR